MNKVYLFLCTFLMSFYTVAQQNQIDSLQYILTTHTQEDTTKVRILVNLANAYQPSRPDTTIVLSELAYQLAEKLNYTRGKALALHRKGNAVWMQGKFPAAIDYALQSLRLFEQIKDLKGEADCYNLIANTHNMEKDYKKAMEYYKKSVEIFEKLGDKYGLGRAYANIGRTLYGQEKYKEALDYLEKAQKTLEEIHEKNVYAAIINTMGDVYQQLGNNEKALDSYFKSLTISEPMGIKRIITYSTRGISEVYQKQGKIKESNEYAERTLKIAKEIGYRENVKNAAFILSDNYKKLGKYQESLDFYTIGSIEKDSMFSIEKRGQMESLRANYEIEKKQKEISLLTVEQELQQKEKNSLVLAIALILLVLLIVYLNLQWQKKDKRLLLEQKQLLQQQKEEIRAINDQLEDMVNDRTQELREAIENLTNKNQDLQQFSYITSHNLRAPVARILGLINIFNQENMNDELNKQLLSHLRTASNSLDEVIKDLTGILSARKMVLVKEGLNLHEIAKLELEHLAEQVQLSKASISTNFAAVDTVYAVKVYMQSVFHNLLSNSIKYRAMDRPLRIEITSQINDNYICILFKDNGLGIEAADPYKIFGLYQRMHTHVEGKGLGLYLVKTQIDAINGKIEVESKLNKGTIFRVYVPYKL